MRLRLELLGTPRLVDMDRGRREVQLPLGKPFAALAYLAVEARPVSRDELSELLWPDAPRERARQSVRQALWILHKTVGEELVVGDDPLKAGPLLTEVDVRDLETALGHGDVDRTRDLWRGPLLHGFALAGAPEWQRWVEETSDLLEQRMFRALLSAAQALYEVGRSVEALPYFQEAIGHNPQSIPARAAYVEALADTGDAAAARDAMVQVRRLARGQEDHSVELEALEARLKEISSRSPSSGAAADRLSSDLEFVGRSDELADLSTLWRRVHAGHSGLAAILGPTGIGKTRLAREFQNVVAGTDGLVVTAKGYRGEHRLPWGTVTDLVRQLMNLPGSAGIGSASDALLRTLVPSRTKGNGRDGNALTPYPAPVADAVVELVEAVAFESPLAVFLDDFQWIDPQSRGLLAQVIRRLQATPCLFLISERTGEEGERRRGGAADLVADFGGLVLTLRPLTEREVRDLLGRVVSFSEATRALEVARRLHGFTGGNPLFLAEVLRKFADDGICQLTEDGWLLNVELVPTTLSLPDNIQGLIRKRLERLSAPAASVAAALARERRAAPARQLRHTSGLDEGTFSRAVVELVQREVATWTTSGHLDFTHDQLREAASLHLAVGNARSWIARHPWAVVVAAVATVVLVLLARLPRVLAGSAVLATHAPTYPYGRGAMVFFLGDSALSARPPAREGGPWRVGPYRGPLPPAPRASPNLRFGPFRTEEGGVRWFGVVTGGTQPPYVVTLHAGGSPPSPLVRTKGDDWFRSLSPDGSRALVTTQDVAARKYALDLVLVDTRNGHRQTLYRGNGELGDASWSPDGQKIAFVASGGIDTLVVVTPSGKEVDRWVPDQFPTLRTVRWCGSTHRLFLGTYGLHGWGAGILDLSSHAFRAILPKARAIWAGACVATGRGVVLQTVDASGQAAFVYHDLRNDATVTLRRGDDLPLMPEAMMRWLPDVAEPVVESVSIPERKATVDWGDREHMALLGRLTNGTVERVRASWSSTDPSVASVDSAGTVTGNRVGRALIIGEYAQWLADTVAVQVVGAVRTDVLFRDQFRDTALASWDVVAYPKPTVTTDDGGPVLSLRGDGMYDDYMLTKRGFDLAHGAALEAEFRLPLTRRDRQRFQMCLARLEEPDSVPRSAWLSGLAETVCFMYPAGELSKFHADQAVVTVGPLRLGREVQLPTPLPRGRWTQVALQVRPDGKVQVYLNHRLLMQPQGRLQMAPSYRWHVILSGAAVDTKLLVRNLTLWRGTRW